MENRFNYSCYILNFGKPLITFEDHIIHLADSKALSEISKTLSYEKEELIAEMLSSKRIQAYKYTL